MGRPIKHKIETDSQKNLTREFLFLKLYHDIGNPNRGNASQCALEAGYTPATAAYYGSTILKRYKKLDLDGAFSVLGVDKIYCALGIKEIMDKAPREADRLAAFRLRLACAGESIEPVRAQAPNVFNGPTMVIVGGTAEKFAELKSGGRNVEAALPVIDQIAGGEDQEDESAEG